MDKLTHKQEQFVHNIATGMTQSDAYRDAYDAENMGAATIWVKASELAASGNVSVRLFEIQEQARERSIVTVQSITEELDEARDVAIKLDQSAAMTTASMGKAKVNGLLVDRLDHTSKDGTMSPNERLTDAQLEKELDARGLSGTTFEE